ncbi:MAG: hypothetical protein LUG98_13225 [Tannerellaceae bacterium]|nr:hypothetical protein [Tannerellaceae bacterium]
MKDAHKELLKEIQVQKMKTKSGLDQLRFLQEQTGRNYEKEIDRLLDFLSQLDELEKKLNN